MTVAQRATAERLIGNKGQSVTIVTVTGAGSYDPVTGSVTPTTTSISTQGVVLPLDKMRKVDGTIINAGDETMLLSALTSAGAAYSMPAVDSVVTLEDGTSKRVIVAIEELAPAGLTIMFDAVVRRVA